MQTYIRNIVNPRAKWAVVYVGAPYGDNEGGHIVEVSATRHGSEQCRSKMGGVAYPREHVLIALDTPRTWGRWGLSRSETNTAREYFNYAPAQTGE